MSPLWFNLRQHGAKGTRASPADIATGWSVHVSKPPRSKHCASPLKLTGPSAEFCRALMELPIFHIDAFTSRNFAGNPAAVVILEQGWLADSLLQAIAAENNLSETAFVITAFPNPFPSDGSLPKSRSISADTRRWLQHSSCFITISPLRAR
jgi:Phenazine biosynthesis-like protein